MPLRSRGYLATGGGCGRGSANLRDKNARRKRYLVILRDMRGLPPPRESLSRINDLRFSRCDDGRVQVDLEPSTRFSLLVYCTVTRAMRVEPYSPEPAESGDITRNRGIGRSV